MMMRMNDYKASIFQIVNEYEASIEIDFFFF